MLKGTEVMVTAEGYFLLTNGICDPGTGNSKACRAVRFLNSSGEVIKSNLYTNRFRFCGSEEMAVFSPQSVVSNQ